MQNAANVLFPPDVQYSRVFFGPLAFVVQTKDVHLELVVKLTLEHTELSLVQRIPDASS